MSFLAVRCCIRVGSQKNLSAVCGVLRGSTAPVSFVQTANITSPGGKPHVRERKPFDYRKRRFTVFHQPFDRTLARLDENSKVIIIDGPMASGKTEFAEKLAHELDFKFVPQPNINDLYRCGDSGLTYQDLDELLAPENRVYDLEAFYKDETPTLADGRCRAGQLQLDYYIARLFAYNDALLHMLSTGQGVVCVRSPWSDRVFAKAMLDNGYLSREGFKHYTDEMVLMHNIDFPRPHLIIYLDASVEETRENIKRRNNPLEMNTKVLTDGYLESIEEDYKETVLPTLEKHSHLLVYPSIPDITPHEVALMVEDIEALGSMDHSGISDDHFLDDWRYLRDEELACKRRDYQDLMLAGKTLCREMTFHVPEMLRDHYFDEDRSDVYAWSPGYEFETSFDPRLSPWWKVALGIPMLQPAAERRFFWVPA